MRDPTKAKLREINDGNTRAGALLMRLAKDTKEPFPVFCKVADFEEGGFYFSPFCYHKFQVILFLNVL